jgi:hypothetical protein
MAQMLGPCSRANRCANESGSAFRMKLMLALAVQRHCFVAVLRDGVEAHALEQFAHRLRDRVRRTR